MFGCLEVLTWMQMPPVHRWPLWHPVYSTGLGNRRQDVVERLSRSPVHKKLNQIRQAPSCSWKIKCIHMIRGRKKKNNHNLIISSLFYFNINYQELFVYQILIQRLLLCILYYCLGKLHLIPENDLIYCT